MGNILLLNEHIAHNESGGIWKLTFRAITNFSITHMQDLR